MEDPVPEYDGDAGLSSAIVTGATGMLGSALVRFLNGKGIRTLSVVRRRSLRAAAVSSSPLNVVVECDLDELSRLPALAGGQWDAFYHLAWAATTHAGREDPFLQGQNILYALTAAEAAAALGCRVLVGAGSQAEYGRAGAAISPQTPVNPDVAYGVCKYAAGRLAAMRCRTLGIRHVWTRIFSTYGPGDSRAALIPYCIESLLLDRRPSLTKCEQMWDFLYCGDCAEALYLLGLRGLDGQTYCIGSGQARPLKDYILTIRDMIDPGLPLGFGEKPYSDIQVMHLCADISSLTRDTGFKPHTRFADGILQTVAWMRESLYR